MATGGRKPEEAHTGTAWRIVHAGTEFFNHARDFVTRNDRWPHKREIAIANHQVAVANAAGVNPYKYFAMTGRRHSALFNLKPGLRFFQNSRSHKPKVLPSVAASVSRMTRSGSWSNSLFPAALRKKEVAEPVLV
jgi:hypothetical protein